MEPSSFTGNTSLDGQLRSLQAELVQCQADKDFVWSLWKRLQVAAPDVGQAIAMVVDRENEKAEVKDHQVLQILQLKDDQLSGLRQEHSEHTAQITQLTARVGELEKRALVLETENEVLKLDKEGLKQQVLSLETTQEESVSRQVVREMDNENMDLKQTLARLEKQVVSLKQDNAELADVRESLKERVKKLDEELGDTSANYGQRMQEHMKDVNSLRSCEQRLAGMSHDNEAKHRELEAVRLELSEMWSSHKQQGKHSSQQSHLIRQLQTLHSDTKIMLKNQENAYSMELKALRANAQSSEENISDLKAQLQQREQAFDHQEAVIGDLQNHLKVTLDRSSDYDRDEKGTQASDEEAEQMEKRMRGMQAEIEMLRRDRSRSQQRHRSVSPGPRLASPMARPLPKSADRGRHRGRDDRLSHDEFDAAVLRDALATTQHKLERTQALLQMRTDELRAIRGAHGKRLDRLRSLQTDHRLLRKQFKLVEEECYGPRKKRKKLQRSAPKSLQKEDSDGVWNELAFFKQANRALVAERMNLQEEVDSLRVQVAQDVATIYELRTCLEQEREELQFAVGEHEGRTSTPRDDEGEEEEEEAGMLQEDLERATRKLAKLSSRTNRLLEENKRLEAGRAAGEDERRTLTAEVNSLRQMDAEHRIEKADLRKHAYRRRRDQRLRGKRGVVRKPSAARQYQRILNQSIQQMSRLFKDFDRDGWEEISDTEVATPGDELSQSDSCEVTGTTDSLGQTIVERARGGGGGVGGVGGGGHPGGQRLRPTARQLESVEEHVERIAWTHDMAVHSPERIARTHDMAIHHSPERIARTHDMAIHSPERIARTHDMAVHHSPERIARTHDMAVHHSPERHMSKAPRIAPFAPARPCRKCADNEAVVTPTRVNDKVAAKVGVLTSRQVAPLRQKITTLQQQVRILKCLKTSLTAGLAQQKTVSEGLQREVEGTTQRLSQSRAAAQRLTAEVERLRAHQGELQQQLESERLSTQSDTTELHLEQDWLHLTARLRNVTSESSKQLAQIKQLKATNGALTTQIEHQQERISHVERDVSQKRNLVDEMRTKLKSVQEEAKSDCEIMSEIEGKFKGTVESNNRYKIQLDALRQRLSTETRDKYENENKVIKLSEELEKKCGQLSDLRGRVSALEDALAAVESTARQQLCALASQSEAAIDTAQEKLLYASSALRQFNKFVGLLGRALIGRVQKARSLHGRQQRRLAAGGDNASKTARADPGSLERARVLASDLLNLTSEDADDLLSLSGADSLDVGLKEAEHNEKRDIQCDKKWNRQWQKILKNKDHFAESLVEVFMEKMDERSELSSRLV